jgi:hypothetical protein
MIGRRVGYLGSVTWVLASLASALVVLLATACAGGNDDQQVETTVLSTATTAVATPLPTTGVTPYPALSVTPPAHRSGSAHELGRDDCPSDWLAWESEPTGFSICYPQSWEKRGRGRPWEEGATITLPQAGVLGAAQVSLLYITTAVEDTFCQCEEPESVTLLGRPATLCVWQNDDVVPLGLAEYRRLIVEAYGYYVPYDHSRLAVSVVLHARFKSDAGPECFLTPPPGFVGGKPVPPEHCLDQTYDPAVKAMAFRILDTLRGP